MQEDDHTAPIATPIPTEVYTLIISYLKEAELARCARASVALHPIAMTRLYANVVIPGVRENDETEVLEDDLPRWQTEGLAIGFLAKRYRDQIATHHTGLISHTTSLLALPKRSAQPSATIPGALAFTKYLTVAAHKADICGELVPLDMPNLVSLRIEPADFGRLRLDVCHCPHSSYGAGCTRKRACVCSFLGGLRPRQIIIGGEETGFAGTASGLFPSPFPDWVKELVCFVGAYSDDKASRDPTETFLDKLPSTVDKLTLVMWTWYGEWAHTQGWFYPCELGETDCSFTPAGLRTGLALACTGNAKVMEVVGMETMLAGWSAVLVNKEIGEVRKEIQRQLVLQGWKEEAAKKRAKEIKFMSGRAYAAGAEEGKVDARGMKGREAVRVAILDEWLKSYGHEKTEDDYM
jgi:hypothetical protein